MSSFNACLILCPKPAAYLISHLFGHLTQYHYISISPHHVVLIMSASSQHNLEQFHYHKVLYCTFPTNVLPIFHVERTTHTPHPLLEGLTPSTSSTHP